MKSKSVSAFIAVFVALFSCSMIGYILGTNAGIKENPPEQIVGIATKGISEKAGTLIANSDSGNTAVQKETKSTSSSTHYILREKDGSVALFTKKADGTESLHSSYDVPIVFLPESDRELLKNGIEFNSIDEIVKFVEDYIG